MASGAILVTGVSRGIGRAVAERAAANGLHVIGLSRTAPEGAFAGEFRAVDLADADATAATLADIVARHRVLRVVNNAGLIRVDRFADAKLEDLETTLALNVRAAVQCTQACLPAMRDAGFGRVVFIGSRAALGKPERAFYSMSKAALVGLARTLALELAADGITANVVAPGPIETELFAAHNAPGTPGRAAIEAALPLGRMGRPEEVAAAVDYFLSDEAGFTTGQTLYVCGGLSVSAQQL